MDWIKYKKATGKTWDKSKPFEEQQAHIKAGLITELSELMDAFKKSLAYGVELGRVNLKEEIGDFFYFYARFCILKKEHSTAFSEVNPFNIKTYKSVDYKKDVEAYIECINSLTFCMYELSSMVNYSSSVKTEIIFKELIAILNGLGVTIKDCLESNIRKLEVRAKNKTISEMGEDRDLEEERNVLS